MPDKIEMAKAYVQIVPSADGIRAALTDVFDEETDGLGAKVGQSIGAQLVGTIKKCLPPLASVRSSRTLLIWAVPCSRASAALRRCLVQAARAWKNMPSPWANRWMPLKTNMHP